MVKAYVPDYALSEDAIVSRSNEPNNPAVQVDLLEGDKVVSSGWIFEKLPGFNSYGDDQVRSGTLTAGQVIYPLILGEMPERLKGADSKSVVPLRGTGGSNPSLSATLGAWACLKEPDCTLVGINKWYEGFEAA